MPARNEVRTQHRPGGIGQSFRALYFVEAFHAGMGAPLCGGLNSPSWNGLKEWVWILTKRIFNLGWGGERVAF